MESEMILPAEIAKRINRNVGFVENALRTGQFPVGKAVYSEASDRWYYLIPRAEFEKWISGELPSKSIDDIIKKLNILFDKVVPTF